MKYKKIIKTVLILTAVLGFLIGIYALVDQGLRPNIVAQGEAKLQNIAINIMNNAVNETLVEVGDISELVQVQKDNSGRITMVSADSTTMNDIAVKSALNAQKRIRELEESQLSIPLGNVIGSTLFSGMDFQTEFETAGINQSRYKIYIVLSAYMKMVVGATSHSVETSTKILISDIIIVGDVPNTYANVPPSDFLNLLP